MSEKQYVNNEFATNNNCVKKRYEGNAEGIFGGSEGTENNTRIAMDLNIIAEFVCDINGGKVRLGISMDNLPGPARVGILSFSPCNRETDCFRFTKICRKLQKYLRKK